jgi:cellulose synthase/poly-beta-1,6-N-acetylglucosamine synthase-like glycosyltransferase
MLIFLTISSLLVFSLAYALFYGYVRYNSRKPWNLKLDSDYQPSVSILIPVHNEEENIEKKLANLQSVDYPMEKIEVIIVDDALEDKTTSKVNETIQRGGIAGLVKKLGWDMVKSGNVESLFYGA